MTPNAPPVREVVLLGGGHSHVQVLRSFGMRPVPGVRLTLVSREVFTPYSGMLPGHVAGFYTWRDIHIDLVPLARFAGARLIPHEVVGLDPDASRVDLDGHPPLRYDVVSINTGAVPVQAGDEGVRVKPIGRFLPSWRELEATVTPGESVVLAGGGAGGVELAMAMQRALGREAPVILVTQTLLPGQNARARRLLRRALGRHGVQVHEGFVARGTETSAGRRLLAAVDGRRVPADHLFWVTGVTAPQWLGASGLHVDADGFVVVDSSLRSVSHPQVFAAGDAAALQGQPRPKAGVFAVREGPVLAANLRRAALGGRLRRFRAQRHFLTILGTADGGAVASRGRWAVSGTWVWRWKDWIDRRFMKRFNDLPAMPMPRTALPAALADLSPSTMRCGGCGAKLAADPLRRVLSRLPDQSRLESRQGVELGIGDDAAVLRHEAGRMLLTVDGFRSLVDDPYLFGRITAHHSLNDVTAMGGRAVAALAMATVPLMSEAMMEEELYQLLLGAVAVLNDHEVPLVGGHSAEGAELSLALTITGEAPAPALTKAHAEPGDVLVLNKALGTGAVLAAHMQGRVDAQLLGLTLSGMDQSNAPALEVLRRCDVHALTDVSGFGLLGHLGEMLRACGLGATVRLDRVPLLSGARALVEANLVSSLQAANEQVLDDLELSGAAPGDARVRLLVDPQTSGGLLAAVSAATADDCVAGLRAAGYPHADAIGVITRTGWRLEG